MSKLLLGEHFEFQKYQKGFKFTHQRVCNRPFGFLYDSEKQNERWQDYRLFWTSPGEKCYFQDSTLKYEMAANRDVHGIALLTSPSDVLDVLAPRKYALKEYSDAFADAWYAILHDNALGFPIDFINCFDHEIIFANQGEILEIIKVHKQIH
jgi:hypothetical protein